MNTVNMWFNNSNFSSFLVILAAVLSLSSPALAAESEGLEISIIQITNSSKVKKRFLDSINKVTSDLAKSYKGPSTPLQFSPKSPTVQFEIYDIDSGKDCLSNHQQQVEHFKKHTLLFFGPVTSDCAKAMLQSPELQGIPILNSLSTVDSLTFNNQYLNGNNVVTNNVRGIHQDTIDNWFFRTVSSDRFRVKRLMQEVKHANNLADLRSLNFGFVIDQQSDYSKGLLAESLTRLKQMRINPPKNNTDTANHQVHIIDINEAISCDTLPMPIHNLLIYMYSVPVQTLVETINSCHLQQFLAPPRYFAIGNPESFDFLPKDSVVISSPNLEQFEDTNIGFKIANSAAYSSTTYLAMEALAQSVTRLSNANSNDLASLRAELRDQLSSLHFRSMLANQSFQFNRYGDIESTLPRASVYRMKTAYALENRLQRQDSVFRLVNLNDLDSIGWFDGDLLMKLLVPNSYKNAIVNVKIERESSLLPCVPFTQWCWDLRYDENIKKIPVNSGVISTYHYTPFLPGEYSIFLLDNEEKRISNTLHFQVTYPKHLLITFLVAALVGWLLMEQTLANSTHKKFLHRRYFGGILLTAFILHLFSVTFRNSDIASFLPFLSFSTNLITNAIIIGVLAGFNGLELIRLFTNVLQARFFPKQVQTLQKDSNTTIGSAKESR